MRKIAVVGLGYVGLPLAVAFGRKTAVIGFDRQTRRIDSLRKGVDQNHDLTTADLAAAQITYTSNPEDLKQADFFVIAVPTPINEARQPDLECLASASETVAPALRPGSIVVYESTVYPGVTEDFCVPILERVSGLRCGRDFKVGYSPERINPGDREHVLERVVKVVSGMDAESLEVIAQTYSIVCEAGVYRAESIRTAEAAKVIENTQRDLNIALMNELAMLFHRMGLDTTAVLAAAGTKWNFLRFRPGLVGGHCIGVDPYYLTHKAETLGYHPQVILAGRRINDGMGKFVAEQVVKMLIRKEFPVRRSRALVLGLTFKEDIADIRNSRVVDIVRELQEFGVQVQICDPHASAADALHEYKVELTPMDKLGSYDAVILAVCHKAFLEKGTDWLRSLLADPMRGIVVDVKSVLPKDAFAAANYWRL